MTETSMRLSDVEITLICERASNLFERLSGQYVSVGGVCDVAARRLKRWQLLSEQNVQRQLAALSPAFASEPASEHQLLELLGPVRQAARTPVPTWALLLNEIVDHVARTFTAPRESDPLRSDALPKKLDIPFEHLYWPLAEFAWDRAVSNADGIASQVSARAKRSLQKHLMRRLSRVASPFLHTAFLAHQAVERSGMLHHFFGEGMHEAGRSGGTRRYESFVAEQGKCGLRGLFTRCPTVARLIAEITELWICFMTELFNRLLTDQTELAMHFNAGAPLGRLLDVKAGLSDPHQGGRSVLIIHFTGGLRLVYKPRSLEIDRIFCELVQSINHYFTGPNLCALKSWGRSGYGWMEYAHHSNCSDRRAAKRYYQRCGALACLIHWLGGIDFHRENVVAAGEQPMLVDLESLAHPLRKEELAFLEAQHDTPLAQSVLRTGLLPLWQPRGAGKATYINCGLDGPLKQRSLFSVTRWCDVNTDRMSCAFLTRHHTHTKHRPVADGRVLSIRAFERDVVTGYRAMIRCLEDPAARELLAIRRQAFQAVRRRIKRATVVYSVLLRASLEPARLVEGIDRSIELLGLPWQAGEEQDWVSEIQSLEALDVPYFQFDPIPQSGDTFWQYSEAPTEKASRDISTVRLSVRRQLELHDGSVRPRINSRPKRSPRKATAAIGPPQ